MGKTKKVRKAGRLGSRYGIGIRKRLLKIEDKQQKRYSCPFCGFKRVKRKGAGIYVCGKCNARFAGGAYLPTTLPGSIIKKTVAQKSFSSKEKGLEEILEKKDEEKEKGEEKKEKEKQTKKEKEKGKEKKEKEKQPKEKEKK